MPGNGKKTQAPCGHAGEAVIGNYVRCLLGCDDAIPEFIFWEKTKPMHCDHNDKYMYDNILWCYTCGQKLS
jgi:hypothetical protein